MATAKLLIQTLQYLQLKKEKGREKSLIINPLILRKLYVSLMTPLGPVVSVPDSHSTVPLSVDII